MEPATGNLDPRLRVLYLLALAVGVFLLREPWQLGVVFGAQLVLWFVARLPARQLVRQLSKLWLLALFIVGTYALFENDPAVDRWVRYSVLGISVPINQSGALEGVLMVVRLLSVVLASQIARAGDARAISAGLAQLRVPRVMGMSLDVVLALLGDGGGRGRGRGGGGGGGGGRGRGGGKGGHGEEAPEPFLQSVKRLARGDVAPIVDKIQAQIARAEAHANKSGFEDKALLRDVSVIAGVSLTMLAIKMLKLLPSLPFAPGHKLVLLTPLYLVAALLTRSRFGATLTGLTMGTVAFLMGDGRYGIFELCKHVAPGLIADALVPLCVRPGKAIPGGLAWSLVGAAIGLGRFATIFLVTLSLQPPAVAFAFLVPGIVLNVFFGVMSGWISYHVVRAASKLRAEETENEQAGDRRRQDPHRVEPDEGVAPGSGGAREDGEPPRVPDHAGRGAGRNRRPVDLR